MPDVTVEVLKVRESASAVLVDADGDGESVWIPKSLVVSLEPSTSSPGLHDLVVSEKTAEEKGLI